MKTTDNIDIHNACVRILEQLNEIECLISEFERKIKVKVSDFRNQEVQYWTLSELNSKLIEHKEQKHEINKIYKDMVEKLLRS